MMRPTYRSASRVRTSAPKKREISGHAFSQTSLAAGLVNIIGGGVAFRDWLFNAGHAYHSAERRPRTVTRLFAVMNEAAL